MLGNHQSYSLLPTLMYYFKIPNCIWPLGAPAQACVFYKRCPNRNQDLIFSFHYRWFGIVVAPTLDTSGHYCANAWTTNSDNSAPIPLLAPTALRVAPIDQVYPYGQELAVKLPYNRLYKAECVKNVSSAMAHLFLSGCEFVWHCLWYCDFCVINSYRHWLLYQEIKWLLMKHFEMLFRGKDCFLISS